MGADTDRETSRDLGTQAGSEPSASAHQLRCALAEDHSLGIGTPLSQPRTCGQPRPPMHEAGHMCYQTPRCSIKWPALRHKVRYGGAEFIPRVSQEASGLPDVQMGGKPTTVCSGAQAGRPEHAV